MQKIRILSENLSNMIAAGEVVERPASVVKEVVENAIDAGSSKIEVSIKDGGKKLIRVADNGDGMGKEDALLSLERHATSKIETPEDLFGISTMGFRGEALASIASVSKLTIATKERGAIEGTEVIVERGAVKDVRAAGIPDGTIIEVKDLFFNTPARKKFLKTTTTELGHISDYVARTALAFPAIAFILRHDNSTLFNLTPVRDPKERIGDLLGREDAKSLIEIDREEAGFRLTGFISPPSVQRSTASALYLYVNGRYVKDKVVRHALLQAYSSFLMRGKYPIAILFIEIDPAEVDVNVHPAKNEVRFRDSRGVHNLVSSTLDGALRRKEWMPEGESLERRIEGVREAACEYISTTESLDLKGGYARLPGSFEGRPVPAVAPAGTEPPFASGNKREEEGHESAGYFSSLTVIGQLGEMYLLCQGAEGLVVIDQHAAYERIAFETLKKGYGEKDFRVQALLIPETVELPPKEAAALEDNLEEVWRLGFDVEPFGGRSFAVKGVPAVLGAAGVKAIMVDMASELSELSASRRFGDVLDDILKRIACHAVVRGRRRMDFDEMRDLLKRMDASGIVPHCPHGRPAHISIPLSEIEKRFERA